MTLLLPDFIRLAHGICTIQLCFNTHWNLKAQ
ncbi:hypothetical protein CCACVL1_18231 [Corchorus capsularis]|uniref:Uncharacterized protein n=1 Tax=Corchorus capsularis TaxID=210143 RepID=A0A1R3HMB2_COCAP|nr:hypothetical protein CCACVL1_18231 [Corchorus capsularis]